MATRRELDLRLEAFRELLWHKSQLMATIPFDRRVMRLTVGCEIRDINLLINQTKKEIKELRDENKNKLLTDEQLEMIEIAVEYLFQRQSSKGHQFRLSLSTVLDKIYVYKKAMTKWPSGHIGVAAFKFLIGKNPSYPMKFDDVIEYSRKKYISLYEAKKKIEAHYTRPIVWRPADIMPSAIGQTPIIYAIVSNDKIARIDMSVFDLPDSSPEVLWQFVCKFYKINFWAYPKDILPSDDERGTTDAAL